MAELVGGIAPSDKKNLEALKERVRRLDQQQEMLMKITPPVPEIGLPAIKGPICSKSILDKLKARQENFSEAQKASDQIYNIRRSNGVDVKSSKINLSIEKLSLMNQINNLIRGTSIEESPLLRQLVSNQPNIDAARLYVSKITTLLTDPLNTPEKIVEALDPQNRYVNVSSIPKKVSIPEVRDLLTEIRDNTTPIRDILSEVRDNQIILTDLLNTTAAAGPKYDEIKSEIRGVAQDLDSLMTILEQNSASLKIQNDRDTQKIIDEIKNLEGVVESSGNNVGSKIEDFNIQVGASNQEVVDALEKILSRQGEIEKQIRGQEKGKEKAIAEPEPETGGFQTVSPEYAQEILVNSPKTGTYQSVDKNFRLNGKDINVNLLRNQGALQIAGQYYDCTSGILQLLFFPDPPLDSFTKRDVQVYQQICADVGFRKMNRDYNKAVKMRLKMNESSSVGDSGVGSSRRTEGSGVQVKPAAEDMNHRLEVIIGSIRAGNRSEALADEAKGIIDKQFAQGLISFERYKKILRIL